MGFMWLVPSRGRLYTPNTFRKRWKGSVAENHHTDN